jgi:hypothetical protein
MKNLSHSQPEARQRRERYYELRRQGVPMLDAAAEVGMTDWVGAQRYERWFQATESGQEIVRGKPGGAPQAYLPPSR